MKIIILAGMAVLMAPFMSNAAMADEKQDGSQYEQAAKEQPEAPKTVQLKVEKVREAKTDFLALAIDSKTGAFYTRMGYGFEGPEVQMYKNAEAFQAGEISEILKLDGTMIAGTYMTASGGQLYGRIFDGKGDGGYPEASVFGRWDLATGQLNAKAEMPGMGGRNGSDTFNWGGFSALNSMEDQTGRYVMGTEGGGTWVVLKLGDDLSVLDARKFEAGSLGWAYMKKGQVFMSDSHDSNRIGQVFDFESGTMKKASYELIGFGQVGDKETKDGEKARTGVYLSMTSYDAKNDTVYFQNTSDQIIYRMDQGEFDDEGEGGGEGEDAGHNEGDGGGVGGDVGAVPEPASWAMLITGFGLTGATMRRRRVALAA